MWADAEAPWALDPMTGRLVDFKEGYIQIVLNIGKEKGCLQLIAHLGF